MKKKMVNIVTLMGWLYQHNLEVRETGPQSKNPGTKYIRGTVDIATDKELTNIVTVNYSYITPYTSGGKVNTNYDALMKIINHEMKSVMEDGAESATMVRIDSAIGLNEFYTDRNGEEVLVSTKRNDGGFIHNTNMIEYNGENAKHNDFKCDMLINGFTRFEADEETDKPEKGLIKGYIFNFRNDMLPVEFVVYDVTALNYFESCDISSTNPLVTQVWGQEVSTTIVKKTVTESAFGDPYITETSYSKKEWTVAGSSVEPYIWDDESFMTALDVKEALSKRQLALAALKKNRDEYKANKKPTAATQKQTAATPQVNLGDFDF